MTIVVHIFRFSRVNLAVITGIDSYDRRIRELKAVRVCIGGELYSCGTRVAYYAVS